MKRFGMPVNFIIGQILPNVKVKKIKNFLTSFRFSIKKVSRGGITDLAT